MAQTTDFLAETKSTFISFESEFKPRQINRKIGETIINFPNFRVLYFWGLCYKRFYGRNYVTIGITKSKS